VRLDGQGDRWLLPGRSDHSGRRRGRHRGKPVHHASDDHVRKVYNVHRVSTWLTFTV
jgi:hypothetical protein